MSNENESSIDNELTRVKKVESEAGSITYLSVSEAIALDKYKKKEQSSKKGVNRCSFKVSKHWEF